MDRQRGTDRIRAAPPSGSTSKTPEKCLAWWSESRGPSCRGGGISCWNRGAVLLSARADRRHGAFCCGQRLAYHFGFSGELRMRLTADRDIRKVRAISAAFPPALNDARMRFAVPSGICSIPPILSLRVLADWLGDDALVGAAAAALLLGPP